MTDTILGYKVASKEQQRRTTIIIAIVAPLAVIAAIVGFYGFTKWDQKGREVAVATVGAIDVTCRYVVQNISKRARLHDHTGYIDCKEARRVARDNEDTLIGGLTGSVQKRVMATVTYDTKGGQTFQSRVQLHGEDPFTPGQRVEVLYRVENPTDLEHFEENAFGFGKKSELAAAELQGVSTAPAAERKPRPSDSWSSSSKQWIGVGVVVFVLAIVFFILRFFYRLIRKLISGGKSSQAVVPGRGAASVSPRMNRAVRQSGFGNRGQAFGKSR